MTKSKQTMPPELMLALSKYFDGEKKYIKEARGDLPPGTYECKCAIQIAGTLTVGEDYESRATARIPLLPTLALFIDLMGGDKAKALAHLRIAMTQVAQAGDGAEKLSEIIPELETLQKEIQKEVVDKMAKINKKGAVTFSGIAERTTPSRTFAKNRVA